MDGIGRKKTLERPSEWIDLIAVSFMYDNTFPCASNVLSICASPAIFAVFAWVWITLQNVGTSDRVIEQQPRVVVFFCKILSEISI